MFSRSVFSRSGFSRSWFSRSEVCGLCFLGLSFLASKFRIGNHNLKIETGRFTIPKTPEDLRICDHCNQNSVENQLHILFHCDQFNDLRKTLFIKINDRNTLFTHDNIHDKVCFLFNNTDSHISRLAADFIFQAFERRKKHS